MRNPIYPQEGKEGKEEKERAQYLLLLGTTPTGPLGLVNALLVGYDVTTLHSRHHPSSLPWSLKVPAGGLSKDVDLDELGFEGSFEGNDALDKQWVSVLHVEMHDTHHSNAHQKTLESRLELIAVVGRDGSCHKLRLITGEWLSGFEVLHGCVVILLIDLAANVHVQRQDDNVGKNVHRPHAIQDIRILERDLLRDLHHTQNDHNIGNLWIHFVAGEKTILLRKGKKKKKLPSERVLGGEEGRKEGRKEEKKSTLTRVMPGGEREGEGEGNVRVDELSRWMDARCDTSDEGS